jgi:hypothetical protein
MLSKEYSVSIYPKPTGLVDTRFIGENTPLSNSNEGVIEEPDGSNLSINSRILAGLVEALSTENAL